MIGPDPGQGKGIVPVFDGVVGAQRVLLDPTFLLASQVSVVKSSLYQIRLVRQLCPLLGMGALATDTCPCHLQTRLLLCLTDPLDINA